MSNNFFVIEESYGVNHQLSALTYVEDFREQENIDCEESVFNENEAIGIALTILDKSNRAVLMTYENVSTGMIEKSTIYPFMHNALNAIIREFKSRASVDGMSHAEIEKLASAINYDEIKKPNDFSLFNSPACAELWNLGYGFRLHEISVEI